MKLKQRCLRGFIFTLLLIFYKPNPAICQNPGKLPAIYKVTLDQAHKGTLETDTLLLCSYGGVAKNVEQFYLDARSFFDGNEAADFKDTEILSSARKHKIFLLGGPMLGNLREDGVSIWIRPASANSIRVKIKSSEGKKIKSFRVDSLLPGKKHNIHVDGLSSGTDYTYVLSHRLRKIWKGNFKTAPATGEKSLFTLTFGSCFHKIGLHNPNLIKQMLKRDPHAILLLGDIAVDDRENKIHMHRSDYLLRDFSNPWKELSGSVPVYSAWDDHDYLNNDLGGIPVGFCPADREALLDLWDENWNNPEYTGDGIFFNTRIGPVELIMLDTRSCRDVEKRGQYGSFLGPEQMSWLKEVLLKSTAPFRIISSGTMWSDYISNGKDSWGTWDTLARKEIFSLLEKEELHETILISGDRHGARAFEIPVVPGSGLYEFQVASLGGAPGPEDIAKDSSHQLFGYPGSDFFAFGEFSFDTSFDPPRVVFRLIDESGSVLEKLLLFVPGSVPGNRDIRTD